MKKLYFFLSLIGMFTFSVGNAQQKTVSGTVLDDLGGPLPGAAILVDGTTRGSTSDFDGNYSIEASLESYSDWRRTGIPVLEPNNGVAIPTRWLYPQSETELNPNTPVVKLTDKVDWDN